MAAPFPIDPHLTSIAIAYRNAAMIADSVLPRVPVGKAEFKWWEYDLADGFTLPDTNVGRTSQPNKVEFNAEERTSSTNDYGLDSPIPQSDIDNAPKNYDPLGRASEQVSNLIELDREVRTAKTVFSANSYPTGNKENVATAAQWDKPDSKPVKSIVTALDRMIMRPNVGIFGRVTATALRMNPSVVRAYNASLGEDGMVPLQFLRELLELEEILVGSAFVNIAKPGQKPNMQRAWSNHASFIYRDKLADTNNGVTFGLTAQFGTRVSGSIPDPNMGLRGGQCVRVGESVKELIVAADVGYFFQNAVAAA